MKTRITLIEDDPSILQDTRAREIRLHVRRGGPFGRERVPMPRENRPLRIGVGRVASHEPLERAFGRRWSCRSSRLLERRSWWT